jgi:hypothetical protein
MQTREELEIRVKVIEEIAQKDSSQEILNAATRARAELESFVAAQQAQKTSEVERIAREIFLVFSGIFGTVMGFYFGAGDSKGPQVNVAATLEDATVVAYATGGTLP